MLFTHEKTSEIKEIGKKGFYIQKAKIVFERQFLLTINPSSNDLEQISCRIDKAQVVYLMIFRLIFIIFRELIC